jgi:serine/threonine protein kinase
MSTNYSHKSIRHVGRYTVSSLLGRGSYSKVYMAVGEDGKTVALKRVSLSRLSPSVRQRLEAEVSIMHTIKHPSIVELITSFRDKNALYLVLEYVNGAELERVISPTLDREIARHFAKQLVDALAYLAKHNIVHRDIKPRNILVQRDQTLKLLDFGFARLYEEQDMMGTICGSPIYMAPELLQMQPYTYKADVWSLGIVLYQLVYGVLPFGHASSIIDIRRIILSSIVPHPAGADPEVVNLINSILCKDPVTRPRLEKIAEHPWLNPISQQHTNITEPQKLQVPLSNATGRVIGSSENLAHLADAIVADPKIAEDMMQTLVLDDDAYHRQHPIDDYITQVPRSEPMTIMRPASRPIKSQYIGSLENLGRGMVKWAISSSARSNY